MVSSETDAGYTNAFRWLVNHVPLVDSPGAIAVLSGDQAPRVIYQALTPTPTPTSEVMIAVTPTPAGKR
jgi:hypothetical protein